MRQWFSDLDLVEKIFAVVGGVLIAVVAVRAGIGLLLDWWVAATMAERLALFAVCILIFAVEMHILSRMLLGVGFVGIFGFVYRTLSGGQFGSGRSIYLTDHGDTIKRSLTRSQNDHVPVSDVDYQSYDAPSQPKVSREASMGVSGESGSGKTNFVKGDVGNWRDDEAIFAHGLRERGGENEVRDFFEDIGFDVLNLSSNGSSHRWDPFLDLDKSVSEMITLAKNLYKAEQVKETGWSSADRMLLSAMLVYTNAEYGDFAQLGDAMTADVEDVLEVVEKVPDGEYLVESIASDEDDLAIVHRRVVSGFAPLLASDICNPDLPSISFREFAESPDGRVIVLDNVTSDKFANGFWRVMMTSAIDIAYEAEGSQQFWLDEVSSLPRIPNLKKLAKAGRKSNTRGIIVIQNYHQLRKVYGEDEAMTIWSNCTSQVMFSAGDEDTARFYLKTIGKEELVVTSRSSRNDDLAGVEDSVTESTSDKYPLTTADLMRNPAGKTLIASDGNWWLAQVREYRLKT